MIWEGLLQVILAYKMLCQDTSYEQLSENLRSHTQMTTTGSHSRLLRMLTQALGSRIAYYYGRQERHLKICSTMLQIFPMQMSSREVEQAVRAQP